MYLRRFYGKMTQFLIPSSGYLGLNHSDTQTCDRMLEQVYQI